MAAIKPSKRNARFPKGTSASSVTPAVFKQSVAFSAAMLRLDILGRRSEPPPGRSKPRLEWERQIADAKRKAAKALLSGQPAGIEEALLANLLVFGQHAIRVGMSYEAAGITNVKHAHPMALVAHFLRGAK
jgi:hypothetical protein